MTTDLEGGGVPTTTGPRRVSGASGRLYDASVLTLLATGFLDVLGGTNVLPVLPIYLKSTGATAFQVNLIQAVYSAVGIPAPMFLARFADVYGQKRVLVVCLLLGIIFWFALGFCKSVQSMVVVRALLGLGCSTGGVATAYLTALVPDETLREKVVGMQTKLSYLAASAGAGIGAMLFGLGGWEGLCAVMAALQLLQLVLGSMFWENVHAISDVVVEASGEGRRGAIHFMRHYSNRDIGPFLFLELINATVQAVFNACIVFVLVEQFSLDASEWMNLISQYCLFSLPLPLMAEFQIRMLGVGMCPRAESRVPSRSDNSDNN